MCLESGITTVADASFSGAAAPACDELGLRAIVCLEIFGSDVRPARHVRAPRERVESRSRSGDPRHLASRRLLGRHRAVRAEAPARPPGADASRRVRDEIEFLRDGGGAVARLPSSAVWGPPGASTVELSRRTDCSALR